MNSKEALKEIDDILYINAVRSQVKDKILSMLEIIKQDLDRLEELEKEHNKLKERYKHRAETSNDLCKAVKQYEKVIEILVNKTIHFMFLKTTPNVETYNKHSDTYNYDKLTKKEYELLKEVLEND